MSKNVYYFPGPSKPGNSEVYVICKNYFGQDKLGPDFMETAMRSTITQNYTDPLLPAEEIPIEFLSKLIDCEEFFICRQIDAIKSNMKTLRC